MATGLTGLVERFLSSGYGDGSSCGNGYGYCDGSSCGNGYGYCNGSGNGDGNGYGKGDGNGYGYGYCNGSGNGDGNGYGNGDGNGDGKGHGNGYGNGDGNGYGISMFCGQAVHNIDGVHTVISSVRGDVAKGAILRSDLTLSTCFIAKVDGHFAHGETAEEAVSNARDKALNEMPEEARIDMFISEASEILAPTGHDWFRLHHTLTLSCHMGRSAFVSDKGISLDAPMSIDEFFATVEGAYGSDTVARARQHWKTLNERKANN